MEYRNVAIYIRVSTEDQAAEGYSISAQKERLEAFCKSQEWTITEYYIEEGQSAKSMDRPELQRLITDVKGGNLDIVLVYKLDRLTRSVLDLYKLLSLFEAHKVAFKSATELYDTSTAIGRLFITLVAGLAQWERENLAERTRMGLIEMARQGKRPGSGEPYGYTFIDGQLVINPAEAAIIRKIYDMYCRGYGIRKIIAWLNNPASPIHSKSGKPWYDSTVSYILRNPLYMGKFVYGGYTNKNKSNVRPIKPENIFQGSHEPIITEDTWIEVQNIFRKKKGIAPRHASGVFPLTGIFFCGTCGGPMDGHTNRRVNSATRYYRCQNTYHKHTCDMRIWKSEYVEEQVIQQLEKQADTLRDAAAQEIRKGTSPVKNEEKKRLSAELRDMKAKKLKWFDAFDSGIIDKADFKERMKGIADREAYLKGRILEIETEEEMPAWTQKEMILKIKNFRFVWSEATPEERKQLTHELIRKVVIFPEGLVSLDLL